MKKTLSWLFGLCLLLIMWQAHSEPYILHKSGAMVLDNATRLIWMRCKLGKKWNGSDCEGSENWLTYTDAIEAASGINGRGGFGGYTDWVVPNIRRLMELVDCFDEPIMPVYKTPLSVTVDERPLEMKFQTSCGTMKYNPYINSVAFPFTGGGKFWSSSIFNEGAWTMSFSFGATSYSARNEMNQIRLVRLNQEMRNPVEAGFTQPIPTGIQVFRTNQKLKP